jgi:tetratricopeptide (TPR) repeat protein
MAALYVADLAATRAAYAGVLAKYPNSAGAHEGLGEFAAAIEGSSQSARAWLAYARLQTDAAKARAALEKAAQLNPSWAEPWVVMAQQASDPRAKIKFLKTATSLELRNAGYWRALAEADLAVNDFPDAAKAWAGAERAAVDDAERARMIKARTDIEQQRLDYEAAERKRQALEKEREIQNLKNAAMERIKEAEARTNQSLNQGKAPLSGKVVPWWDGPQPAGKVQGVLLRVECLGKKARLVIQGDDRKLIRLLVPDPSQIVIQGAPDANLGCGEQRPQRKVAVAYFPKPDKATGTVGEAAQVDFSQ